MTHKMKPTCNSSRTFRPLDKAKFLQNRFFNSGWVVFLDCFPNADLLRFLFQSISERQTTRNMTSCFEKDGRKGRSTTKDVLGIASAQVTGNWKSLLLMRTTTTLCEDEHATLLINTKCLILIKGFKPQATISITRILVSAIRSTFGSLPSATCLACSASCHASNVFATNQSLRVFCGTFRSDFVVAVSLEGFDVSSLESDTTACLCFSPSWVKFETESHSLCPTVTCMYFLQPTSRSCVCQLNCTRLTSTSHSPFRSNTRLGTQVCLSGIKGPSMCADNVFWTDLSIAGVEYAKGAHTMRQSVEYPVNY